MRKEIIYINILMIFCLSFSACNSQKESIKSNAEVKEDDFVYRLISEKDEYNANESVKLYAELEYVGNKESITIYHGTSPFYFPIFEKTRGYEIDYIMNLPLMDTILNYNEPIREEYLGGGGYDENDRKEYVDFIKEFSENGFPNGEYVVNGYARLYTKPDGKEKKEYVIKAKIRFIVDG